MFRKSCNVLIDFSRDVGRWLVAALTICIVLCVAFIEPALAYYADEQEDTSPNGQAYAKVKGWYTEALTNYYKEYHEGSVGGHAGSDAYSEFRGWNGQSYYNKYDLSPNQGTYRTYHKLVKYAKTYTDSDYQGADGRAWAQIGPSGLGP